MRFYTASLLSLGSTYSVIFKRFPTVVYVEITGLSCYYKKRYPIEQSYRVCQIWTNERNANVVTIQPFPTYSNHSATHPSDIYIHMKNGDGASINPIYLHIGKREENMTAYRYSFIEQFEI